MLPLRLAIEASPVLRVRDLLELAEELAVPTGVVERGLFLSLKFFAHALEGSPALLSRARSRLVSALAAPSLVALPVRVRAFSMRCSFDGRFGLRLTAE